jgi:hypothetical protein
MAKKPKNDDLAVEFEQRKIGADRYESLPRRRSDKRLFDTPVCNLRVAIDRQTT